MKRKTFKRAACAALLLGLAPIPANAADLGTAASTSAIRALTPSGAVDSFYRSRGGAPLWLKDGPRDGSAMALLAVLRGSSVDGFERGPELAAEAEALLARAEAGDNAAATRAERLLSTAWVTYVQALRAPPVGMTYADQRVAPRPIRPEQVLAGAAKAPSLPVHVREISRVNPIYAQLREAAVNQLPLVQAAARLDSRLQTNLERARALPTAGRYVVVDAASQRLLMVEDGNIVDSMKVVVGKPGSPTPMVASTIYYATLNPYWNLPADLTKKLIAPRVLEQGVGYLTKHGYEVLSGFEDDAQPVDPSSVDWKAVASGETAVRVRQLPGPSNAMGEVKFSFPNTGGIFLHDTDNKALFKEDVRTFSNGCVRLEDARRLAEFLFDGNVPKAASDAPEQHVALPNGVPVYITYLTVQPDGGRLAWIDDVYKRDVLSGGSIAMAR